jgi:hypothetical protein
MDKEYHKAPGNNTGGSGYRKTTKFIDQHRGAHFTNTSKWKVSPPQTFPLNPLNFSKP